MSDFPDYLFNMATAINQTSNVDKVQTKIMDITRKEKKVYNREITGHNESGLMNDGDITKLFSEKGMKYYSIEIIKFYIKLYIRYHKTALYRYQCNIGIVRLDKIRMRIKNVNIKNKLQQVFAGPGEIIQISEQCKDLNMYMVNEVKRNVSQEKCINENLLGEGDVEVIDTS